MKKEEIQGKVKQKIQAIQTLCKQLQIEIVAKQMINQDGFIENVVYYLDIEKYEVDKEEPKEEQKEIKEEPKKNEEITNIRG